MSILFTQPTRERNCRLYYYSDTHDDLLLVFCSLLMFAVDDDDCLHNVSFSALFRLLVHFQPRFHLRSIDSPGGTSRDFQPGFRVRRDFQPGFRLRSVDVTFYTGFLNSILYQDYCRLSRSEGGILAHGATHHGLEVDALHLQTWIFGINLTCPKNPPPPDPC
jgi:hypothetical protein